MEALPFWYGEYEICDRDTFFRLVQTLKDSKLVLSRLHQCLPEANRRGNVCLSGTGLTI